MNTFLVMISMVAVAEYYFFFRQARPGPSGAPRPDGRPQRVATPREAGR